MMDMKEALDSLEAKAFTHPKLLAVLSCIRELEARAENAERERDEAIKALSDESRKRGEAEGRLEASEMAGVVDGWKVRAEKAEAANKRFEELLRLIPRQINYAITAGIEEREGGSYRRQEKLLEKNRLFVDEVNAALAAMEATDE